MAIDRSNVGALFALFNSVQCAADAQALVRRDVAAARKAGASWGDIGMLLGVTGEAARQKFDKAPGTVFRGGPVAATA